jgi:signal transduction histidine kinase
MAYYITFSLNIYTVVLFSLLLCVIGYFAFRLRYIQNLYKLEKYQRQIKEFIMESNPLPWCSFDTNCNNFSCSLSFKALLGVPAEQNMTVPEFYKIVSAHPLSPLYQAVQDSINIGSLFSIQNTLKHIQKEIIISGQKLTTVQKNFTHKKTNSNEFIFITLEDITDINKKRQKEEVTYAQTLKEKKIITNIADSIPIALWHRNAQGRIDYCNETYANALECSIAKIKTENLELFSKNDINLHQFSEQSLAKREPSISRQYAVVQGKRRFVEVGIYPIPETFSTVGYALDCSETEDLASKLSSTTSAYHEIFNTISIPIAVFDERKNLHYYNTAYTKLFDFKESFLEKNITFADILDDLRTRKKIPEHANFKEYKKKRAELFNNIIKPIEEFIDLPNEDTLRVRIAPYPLGGLIFVYENITDKLNLERGVNTLLAVQKETINHLYEALIVIEKNGKIQFLNKSMELLFNIQNANTLVGAPFNSWTAIFKQFFLDEKQHTNWTQYLSSLFINRHPINERLFLLNDLVINWFYTPLPDGSHMLGFLNVSEEWNNERQLKAHSLNLEKKNTLKQNYINQITYELQKPINNIIGFSKSLTQQLFGPLNEKQLNYCQLIENNTENVKFLIDDVLCLIGLDQYSLTITPQPFILQNMLNALIAIIEPIFQEKGIDFTISNTATPKKVVGSEKHLKQALFAIIKDLVIYTPERATISINIKSDQEEKHLTLEIEAPYHHKLNKENQTLGHTIACRILDSHHIKLQQAYTADKQIISFDIPVNG